MCARGGPWLMPGVMLSEAGGFPHNPFSLRHERRLHRLTRVVDLRPACTGCFSLGPCCVLSATVLAATGDGPGAPTTCR